MFFIISFKNQLFLLFILIIISLHSTVSANDSEFVLQVNADLDGAEISPFTYYLQEDIKSVEEVLNIKHNRWIRNTEKIYKPHINNRDVWLKLNIKNTFNYQTELSHDPWLFEIMTGRNNVVAEIKQSFISYTDHNGIDYFKPLNMVQFGNVLYPTLEIPIHQIDTATIYIQYHFLAGVYLPLKLYSQNFLIASILMQFAFDGAIFGSIIVLFLYNFFIFYQLKAKPYFYYSAYILFVGYTLLVSSSSLKLLALQYYNVKIFENFISPHGYYCVLIMELLFLDQLFNLKEKMKQTNRLVIVVCCILFFLLVVDLSFMKIEYDRFLSYLIYFGLSLSSPLIFWIILDFL